MVVTDLWYGDFVGWGEGGSFQIVLGSPEALRRLCLSASFQHWQGGHTRQGIYGRQGLEKVNNVTLPEVKLLVENSRVG